MYDLTLIPIHTQQGQPLQQISGFKGASPPKRSARSRSEDLLILSLIIQGEAKISPEVQAAWLDRLAQVFFKTSGAVTSALRSLIETLNLTLMEKNLKLAQEGGWMTGAINLAAVHRRSLYIVQSGLTHAFTLSHEGLGHFQDPEQSDRGLGLSRNPTIRYFQADLGTGGYLFMTDTPPETWREDLLLADGFPSQEKLRRRLLNQAPVDFRLDLVQLRPGEGEIQMQSIPVLRPEKQLQETAREAGDEREEVEYLERSTPEADFTDVTQQDTQEVPVLNLLEKQPDALPEHDPKDSEELDVDEVSSRPEETSVPDSIPKKPKPPRSGQLGSKEKVESPVASLGRDGADPIPQVKRARVQIREEGLQGLASFFDWWHKIWNKVGYFFRDLIARFLPEKEGQGVPLAHGTLLWVAVFVPLAVGAIAVGVYLSRGRRLQYDYYLDQAQAASQTALAAGDPAVERSAWVEMLNALDQADDIQDTDEVAALRQEAQDALDILDGALRLVYQPALADILSVEINIREMVSYGLDLYLFDEASGWVIHAMRENDIYEVDTNFICAPGNYSGGSLSRIVDIVSLPINNPYQAHILVIDEIGNVAYCSPSQDPVVQALPEMSPEVGEGNRIAYENNTLYVLKPSINSILVYSATNGQFLDPPDHYFEGAASPEIPDLTQVVDLDVNGPELYLLRGDGSLVNCVFSGFPDNPVTCQNPVEYLDGRAGLEEQTLSLPESRFTSVFYTPPPTPLINILDATHAEIYRFSLRFRLYQRLRPDIGDYAVDASAATAFTLGEIEPLAFIAFGNQVFYAYVE
jgi:hypothetical protein